MHVGRRFLRTVLITGSALGLTAGGAVLALASGPGGGGGTKRDRAGRLTS
jgi:hypothetical protein